MHSCIYLPPHALSLTAGDLGAIEAKYDIAVSTAAGALDYIVVDDTATAQRCVELLRKQALGVATFLLLDKQAHLAAKMAARAAPPEGALRLLLPACLLFLSFAERAPKAELSCQHQLESQVM